MTLSKSSEQRLSNFKQTHLVLASGKLVLQKRVMNNGKLLSTTLDGSTIFNEEKGERKGN